MKITIDQHTFGLLQRRQAAIQEVEKQLAERQIAIQDVILAEVARHKVFSELQVENMADVTVRWFYNSATEEYSIEFTRQSAQAPILGRN